MKFSLLTFVLSAFLFSNSFAQVLTSNSGQLNLNADYPSGKMRAYSESTMIELDKKNGKLAITCLNKSFLHKPALKPALKKELESYKQHTSTSIKAQITNIKKIDLTKDGRQKARVIGRFSYNGVTSTFYEKAEVIIEAGVVTMNMQLEVLLSDHDVEGVGKSNMMVVDLLVELK